MERPLDAERVAALLDGKLSKSEREVVLAQIAQSTEWRDVLAMAAGSMNADEASAAPAPSAVRDVLSMDVANGATQQATAVTRFKRWPVALAAGLVLSLGMGYWYSQRPIAKLQQRSLLTIAMNETQSIVLDTAGFATRWPRFRSTSVVIERRPASVRMGVLAVDMLWAVAHGRAELRETLQQDFLQYLSAFSGSAQVKSDIVGAANIASLQQAFESARAMSDARLFDLGVTIETARLSLHAGATRDAPMDELLAMAKESMRGDSAAIAALARLQLVSTTSTARASAMAALDSLLSRVAQ